jgi:hypothetical protein
MQRVAVSKAELVAVYTIAEGYAKASDMNSVANHYAEVRKLIEALPYPVVTITEYH